MKRSSASRERLSISLSISRRAAAAGCMSRGSVPTTVLVGASTLPVGTGTAEGPADVALTAEASSF